MIDLINLNEVCDMLNSRCSSALSIVLILCAVLPLVFFMGCAKETEGYASDIAGNPEDLIPKDASDSSVLALWDEYDILNHVPRYEGDGIFDSIVETESGGVNVYYNGVPLEDYEAYNNSLKNKGFKLAKGSSVIASNGGVGTPVYVKSGELKVKLVWILDGMFAITVDHP